MSAKNMVQLRWEDGMIEEVEDPLLAWEKFKEDDLIWKISWTSPNGKRVRITKISTFPTTLDICYVEDIMARVESDPRLKI